MDLPLISVIVPVYNVRNNLAKSLSSLVNQTFKDWEAICVDDGSTDGSSEVLELFACKDSRIKVIHKANGGVSSARNSGLDSAVARYITMLDADDFFEPNALEKLYDCMQVYDCDIVCCIMRKIFQSGRVEVECAKFDMGVHEAVPEDVYRFALRSSWGKLYKREILENSNVRFPLGISICEDDVFVVTYWYHVKRFYMLDEPLYNYVQSETSVLRKLGEKKTSIDACMATLDVPLLICRHILKYETEQVKIKLWVGLLLKSLCNIYIWMIKCNPDAKRQKTLTLRFFENRKELKKNLPLIKYAVILARIYILRQIKKVRRFADIWK